MQPTNVKIVRFEMLSPGSLEPHPEARLPIDTDDFAVLERSVAEGGVMNPLIVEAEPAKNGKHRILDGVNRWYAFQNDTSRLAEKLPCCLVECADPRAVALTCLVSGRKRSASQRVYAYVRTHLPEILAARETGLGNGRPKKGVSRDTPFSNDSIARNLRCSNKDVIAAIELAKCVAQKVYPGDDRARRKPRELDLEARSDAAFYETLTRYEAEVLMGRSPTIRRWKAAVMGRQASSGVTPQKNPLNRINTAIGALLGAIDDSWGELDEAQAMLMRERIAELNLKISEEFENDILMSAMRAAGELRTAFKKINKLSEEDQEKMRGAAATLLTFLPPLDEAHAYVARRKAAGLKV